jgi:hypothetical protein
MPDGAVRLVIVNPSPGAAADITARGLGHDTRASVQWLIGPSLGATSGVSLGGAEVGADGTWRPLAATLLAGSADAVHIHMRPQRLWSLSRSVRHVRDR